MSNTTYEIDQALLTSGQLQIALGKLIKSKKFKADEFMAAVKRKTPEEVAAEINWVAMNLKADCKHAQNGVMVSDAHYVETAIVSLVK